MGTLSEPLAQARKRFAARGQALARLDKPALAAAEALSGWGRENLLRGGGLLEGAGWPRLAAATLAKRQRRGPLYVTGRLYRGFAVERAAGAGPKTQAALAANRVAYAARHHEGEGVPRRPLFPGPAQLERLVFPLFDRFIKEGLR